MRTDRKPFKSCACPFEVYVSLVTFSNTVDDACDQTIVHLFLYLLEIAGAVFDRKFLTRKTVMEEIMITNIFVLSRKLVLWRSFDAGASYKSGKCRLPLIWLINITITLCGVPVSFREKPGESFEKNKRNS